MVQQKACDLIELVKTLQLEVSKRFSDYEKNALYVESTILDPRFKSRGFKNESNFKYALDQLKMKLRPVEATSNVDCLESEATVDVPAKKPSIWDSYDAEFKAVVQPENIFAASQREIDKYLAEEYLDRKSDPLSWWKEKKAVSSPLCVYA
jgi:hypothetical protein